MSLKDKINNIITDLETPSTDYIESLNQQNQWGKILNDKTFKTLNNNIKLLKEILTELVNSGGVSGSGTSGATLSSEAEIKLRLTNLETDMQSIESLVDNNTPTEIKVGKSDRDLNLINNGNIKVNGINDLLVKKEDLKSISDVAYTNKSNTFTSDQNITNLNISGKLMVGGQEVKPTTTSSQPTGITGKGFKEVHSNYFQLISLPVDSGAGNTAVFKYTFPVPFSKKPEVQATNVNTSRGAYFLIITEITPEYVLLSSNYYSNATYVNLLAFTLDS